VTLRLSAGLSTTGGEFSRLLGLASDYLSVGAQGFVLGFLTPALDPDVEVCEAFVHALPGVPWEFDRAFDQALDPRRAWRMLADLPGLDDVHSAGAALGMDHGFDELLALAAADPRFAAHVMAAGGVRAEHAPWLLRAGVRRFHLGTAVRPGGSWGKAYVDSRLVRSWRRLLDDAADRAAG
jgi:copper homeostasis protein